MHWEKTIYLLSVVCEIPFTGTSSFSKWLGGNNILTLDEAAGVLVRRDVPEGDVSLYCAKERNPVTDEHGNACDQEALNEPGLKEPLNGDAAIHVDMPHTASGKPRQDLDWSP
jgi:hypothetical protein